MSPTPSLLPTVVPLHQAGTGGPHSTAHHVQLPWPAAMCCCGAVGPAAVMVSAWMMTFIRSGKMSGLLSVWPAPLCRLYITNVQCQDAGKIISMQTHASTFIGLVTRGNLFFRTYVDFWWLLHIPADSGLSPPGNRQDSWPIQVAEGFLFTALLGDAASALCPSSPPDYSPQRELLCLVQAVLPLLCRQTRQAAGI